MHINSLNNLKLGPKTWSTIRRKHHSLAMKKRLLSPQYRFKIGKTVHTNHNKRYHQEYQKLIEQMLPSNEFIAWFVGFWEGEGGIDIETNSIILTITQKDITPLISIQKELGFGKLWSPDSSQCNTLAISRLAQIKFLLPYLFKYMRSEKRIKQVTEAVQEVNKKQHTLAIKYQLESEFQL